VLHLSDKENILSFIRKTIFPHTNEENAIDFREPLKPKDFLIQLIIEARKTRLVFYKKSKGEERKPYQSKSPANDKKKKNEINKQEEKRSLKDASELKTMKDKSTKYFKMGSNSWP